MQSVFPQVKFLFPGIEFQISWNSVGCQVETRLIAEIRRQFFLAQYVAIAILLDFIVIWWEDADFSEFHESRRNFFYLFWLKFDKVFPFKKIWIS